jgi:hypothetical protein
MVYHESLWMLDWILETGSAVPVERFGKDRPGFKTKNPVVLCTSIFWRISESLAIFGGSEKDWHFLPSLLLHMEGYLSTNNRDLSTKQCIDNYVPYFGIP